MDLRHHKSICRDLKPQVPQEVAPDDLHWLRRSELDQYLPLVLEVRPCFLLAPAAKDPGAMKLYACLHNLETFGRLLVLVLLVVAASLGLRPRSICPPNQQFLLDVTGLRCITNLSGRNPLEKPNKLKRQVKKHTVRDRKSLAGRNRNEKLKNT